MREVGAEVVVGVDGGSVTEGIEVGAADGEVIFGLGEGGCEGEEMGSIAGDAFYDEADEPTGWCKEGNDFLSVFVIKAPKYEALVLFF